MKKTITSVFALAALLVTFASTPSYSADEAATKSEPTSVELKDGTKVTIDGDSVSVIGADGKATPAPDGTHETKDGEMITTKGGKLVE